MQNYMKPTIEYDFLFWIWEKLQKEENERKVLLPHTPNSDVTSPIHLRHLNNSPFLAEIRTHDPWLARPVSTPSHHGAALQIMAQKRSLIDMSKILHIQLYSNQTARLLF